MNTLKKIRLKRGLSQEEVAKKMQVTPATVCRWESGEFLPRADKLLALAKLFKCSIDTLLKSR